MALTRGPVLALLVLAAGWLGLFETPELKALDSLFALRGGRDGAAPIVIVSIGEDSFDELNLAWPWPRALQGEIVERIAAGRPAAIGIDVAFPEPSGRGPDDDEQLAESIGRAKRVVLAAALSTVEDATYRKEDLNPPIPLLRDRAAGYGPVNFRFDADAFVRTAGTSIPFQGRSLPTFAAVLYDQAVNAGVPAQPMEQGDFLINFRGRPGSFPVVPAYRVLDGHVPPDVFRDKIVLIGATSFLLHDMYPTPFAPQSDMPGVEIHANALDTLLQGIPIHRAPKWIGPLAILAAGIAAVWTAARCAPVPAFLWLTGGALAFAGAAFGLFTNRYVALDLVPVPVCLLLGYGATVAERFILEQRQRGMLMQLFSKHVSPEVAEAIWAQRESFLTGGRLRSQKLAVTVLFTDLKGFTGISERMDTSALMDWINDYMEVMAKLVMRHGGVVDDYFGDAIKANFGVPFPKTTDDERAQDALRAVECALAMGRELQRLNGLWQAQGLPPVGMRVGIYSGQVVAGCVGSTERLKYTTIGDVVNTASRLESYDKELSAPDVGGNPCRILIGESTYRLIHDRITAEPAGSLQLKGKEQPVPVYRVLATM